MSKAKQALWGFLITTAFALSLYGQSEYRFKYFTSADGFVFQGPTDIVQDSLGFLWMVNYAQIIRYDGYRFKSYVNDSQDTLSPPNDSAIKLLLDRSGRLWLYNGENHRGDGSLLQYDPRIDGFIRHKSPIGDGYVESLCFDKRKDLIWLGGGGGHGLYAYSISTRARTKYAHAVADSALSLARNSVYGIRDLDSVLLLGTADGLWKFDKQKLVFGRPRLYGMDSAFLLKGWVSIPNQNEDSKWVLSEGFMTRLDEDMRIAETFPLKSITSPDGFDEDQQGNVWFANRSGLHRYNPIDKSIKIINDPASGDSWMWNVVVDRDDNIWGMSAGGSLMKLKKRRIQTNRSFDVTLGAINVMKPKGGAKILITADRGTLYTASADSAGIKDLRSVSYTGRDQIGNNLSGSWVGEKFFWIAVWNQGILGISLDDAGDLNTKRTIRFQHDSKNPYTISDNGAYSVYEDPQGSLWLASNFGLSKIDTKKTYGTEGSVTRYYHNPLDSNSLSSNEVRYFVNESANSFWVMTISGLDLFVDGKFYRQKSENVSNLYKTRDGTYYIGTSDGYFVGKLVGNRLKLERKSVGEAKTVIDFCEDDSGRIWMVTTSGISVFDPADSTHLRLDQTDDLIENPGSIKSLGNGLFVVIGSGGISVIDGKSVKASHHTVFPALTGLLINNKVPMIGNRALKGKVYEDFSLPSEISVLEELVLDYRHNNFTLEFSAMEMTSPEKNLYRHRLEGYDKEWIETDYLNRTASYTNLPAGTYIFRVKASNHHGIWNEVERTLSVVILPPPWRTWWAYTGYGLLAVGLLLLARRNIVQRERLKANLQLAQVEQEKEHFELEKAQEVDRVKSSFFTNISHEFRTPLTLIKGPVDSMLERYKDDPEAVKRLKLVQRNSDLLLRLINQLLDLAKLESGSLKVEKSEGEVNGFIRAVASSFESLARQKGVTLKLDVPSEPTSALFDKDKVETILINLVNNAIKFTPQGGEIRVVAGTHTSPPTPLQRERGVPDANTSPLFRRGAGGEVENAANLTIRISDTGIGIPADQQSKIFERFHQVSEAHKEVGTGIGLSLVKELVALMEGTISVKSEVGKGSEFTVTLPMESASPMESMRTSDKLQAPPQLVQVEAEPELDQVTKTPSALRPGPSTNGTEAIDPTKPHILVVEDNADLRAFIIDSLGTEFHFLEAENGKIGLDTAIEQIPDLIISDVMMPEMDGMEMTQKIKSDIKTSHIPLILLTAKSSEESKLTGLQSGADDYLTKPFNRQELLLKVRNGVSRQMKLREKLRAELLSVAPKVEVLSADEQFLQKVKETIIDQLSNEQLSVESLADDMGMSRVQLYRKVSGLTGMAVNELIRKLRLQRAAQLLGQEWGPVSQVAYEVGFSNLSYFSKVFKEEFGVLPSEYEKA